MTCRSETQSLTARRVNKTSAMESCMLGKIKEEYLGTKDNEGRRLNGTYQKVEDTR